MSDVAKLTVGGKTYEYPIFTGSEGEKSIDISTLRKDTGYVTLDPGFVNTGSCTSEITFINGEEGILRYRGYPIEQLAEKSTFLEVAYLLLKGELPKKQRLEAFTNNITHHTLLHEDIRLMFRAFPLRAHPMAIMSAVMGTLSTFYPDSLDPFDDEQVRVSIHRILAKMCTIAAYSYKYSIGHPFVYPQNRLSYAANILYMMFATPSEPYEVDPILERAIDVLLILHADHEQNCSTSTMRLVGSSDANIYASVSAAVNALWGPLHGGANQAVIEMLYDIRDNYNGDGHKYLEMAKDSSNNIRLMGFGHRVYKNYDPRAKILKQMNKDVLKAVGGSSDILDIAMQLEGIALEDDYFIERKLYPNVDFYSGIIYKAMGIPVNMFTVFFTLGRMPGWLAQWSEHHANPHARIGRPRQIYTGPKVRDYVPADKR
jgi:citrate synthase